MHIYVDLGIEAPAIAEAQGRFLFDSDHEFFVLTVAECNKRLQDVADKVVATLIEGALSRSTDEAKLPYTGERGYFHAKESFSVQDKCQAYVYVYMADVPDANIEGLKLTAYLVQLIYQVVMDLYIDPLSEHRREDFDKILTGLVELDPEADTDEVLATLKECLLLGEVCEHMVTVERLCEQQAFIKAMSEPQAEEAPRPGLFKRIFGATASR